MPTPDASQFTQLKKYTAVNHRQDSQRARSHLYQPVPSVSHPVDFLASFTNKFVSTPGFTRINVVTGREAKPKVPGGNVNGQNSASAPPALAPVSGFRISNSYAYWGPGQTPINTPCNYRFRSGDKSWYINNDTGTTYDLWYGINGDTIFISIPTGYSYEVVGNVVTDVEDQSCPTPD